MSRCCYTMCLVASRCNRTRTLELLNTDCPLRASTIGMAFDVLVAVVVDRSAGLAQCKMYRALARSESGCKWSQWLYEQPHKLRVLTVGKKCPTKDRLPCMEWYCSAVRLHLLPWTLGTNSGAAFSSRYTCLPESKPCKAAPKPIFKKAWVDAPARSLQEAPPNWKRTQSQRQTHAKSTLLPSYVMFARIVCIQRTLIIFVAAKGGSN